MVRRNGYQAVYATTLVAQAALGSAGLALAFGVLLLNIRIALRALSIRTLVLTTREGPVAVTVDRRSVQAISTAFATVMALLCGLYASGQWQEWLMFRHAQPFGEVDPVLGKDISFYIFRLPFLDLLSGYLLVLIVLSGAATLAVYAVAGAIDINLRRGGGQIVDLIRGLRIVGPAKRHLAALAAALLLVLAFGAYLDVPRLLTTPAGIVHGAANVDVAVRIPALRLLMVAALAGAALALFRMTAGPVAT